ncbi:unnamed protein product [Lactuca saligna]|uniref:Serine-threonine/tyrosine-protein kinase catalytic domain-containing protein n=1 Tax=Lactuca saligna TaxID=75948 RepID=A0AA35VJG5_LACSI|nr:unnamed protein product [Lactuca saligna]
MTSDHRRLYNNSFSYSNPRSRLLPSYISMATRLNRNSTTSNERILGDRIVPHLWFVAYTTASPPCSTLICPSLSVLHHLLHMVMFMNVLNKEGLQGHKEWLTEVNFLVQLRHPNLVKLIGYCYEDDHRLLVYEFMFRGSLENHLFRRGRNTMHGHKSGTDVLLDLLSRESPHAPASATQKSS